MAERARNTRRFDRDATTDPAGNNARLTNPNDASTTSLIAQKMETANRIITLAGHTTNRTPL